MSNVKYISLEEARRRWPSPAAVKLDSLGRRNNGWSYVNKNKKNIVRQFDRRFGCSISNEDYNVVLKNAKRRGVSLSEMIRIYIEWGLENDK